MIQWEKIKQKSITSQLNFLGAIHYHHLLWANHATDPQLERIHLLIAELVMQIIVQYRILLEKYIEHREE